MRAARLRGYLQFVLVVGMLVLIVATTAMAQLFSARLDSSQWRSVEGNGACHLSHDVSRFGLALITERPGSGLSAAVISRRGPPASRRGRARGVNTPWQPDAQRTLFAVTAQPGPTVLRMNAAQTMRTLQALESGQVVRFDFDTWQAGSAAIDLSPVGFRAALRDHTTCVAKLSGSTASTNQPREDRAGARRMDTAAAAPNEATAVPMVASAEIEQLPPPPQFIVHFASDSVSLDKPDYDTLKAAASAFSAQPFWSRILVTGHADSSGTASYNRHLALLRAIEIRNRLVRLGVDKSKLKVRTAGEEQPAAEARDESQRAANRRVEIQALL